MSDRSELPPELLQWLADRALSAEPDEEGMLLVGRNRRHWAPGFVPETEVERLMGRRVDPHEEITIKRQLAVMLKRVDYWHRTR